MKKSNLANFSHLDAEQIKLLAKGSKCDERYVRMILAGDRKHKSVKARAIYSAAKELNKSIAVASKKAKKQLVVIDGEND